MKMIQHILLLLICAFDFNFAVEVAVASPQQSIYINENVNFNQSSPKGSEVLVKANAFQAQNFAKRYTFQKRNFDKLYEIRMHGTLKALADFMLFWKCRNILVIVDSKAGLTTVGITRFLDVRQLRADAVLINSREDVNSQLIDSIIKYRFIVLLCGEKTSEEIFIKAKTPVLFTQKHIWIIVASLMPAYWHSSDFRLYFNSTYSQVTVLQLIQNNDIDEPVLWKYFWPNLSWETPVLHDNKTEIFNQQFLIDYEQVSEMNIYDAFYSPQTNQLEVIKFATWRIDNGLHLLRHLDGPWANSQLRGRPVNVISFADLGPYIVFDKTSNTVGGYVVKVFSVLESHLNARFNVTIDHDLAFGAEMSNGTFTGLLGYLQSGQYGVALALGAILETRKRAVRYITAPLASSYNILCFNKPEATVPSTIYLLPFAENVWIFVSIGLVILLIFLFFIVVLHPTTKQRTWSYWLLSGTFLVDAFHEPPGYSGRVVFFTLITATMISFAYYNSAFTSLLTYREMRLPIRNLEELEANKDYKPLVVKQSVMHLNFEEAKGGIFQKVMRKITYSGQDSFVNTYEDGYAKMLTGKYIFISDGPGTRYLARGNCKVTFTGQYMKQYYHLLGSFEFPYTSIISSSLIRMTEAGILHRLKTMYISAENSRCGPETASSQTLNFSQVVTLFIFLLMMTLVSLLTLSLEIILYKGMRLPNNEGG